MSHLFAPGAAAPVLAQTITPAQALTPTQSPVGTQPVKSPANPSFLGSATLPASAGTEAPNAGNQKKLIGQ